MGLVNLTISHDTLTPVLRRLERVAPHSTPVLRSGGNALLSIVLGTFSSVGAAFRPTPWPAKVDGRPSNLTASTLLARSWRLEVKPGLASVISARQFAPGVSAAIHQFGGVIRATTRRGLRFRVGDRWITKQEVVMPARPFLPIHPDGRMTDQAARLVVNAMNRALDRLLKGLT